MSSYTYDSNGNVLSSTNSEGAITRTYDELGRVLTKSVPSIGQTAFTYDIISGVGTGEVAEASTDPKGNITTKVYDRVGRLKKVADGNFATGDITTYTYYDNGNRDSVEYPDRSREEYTYY